MEFRGGAYDELADETAVNLRAYFDCVPDLKMRDYSPAWNDERVIAWDGNFRDDGNLMLICCERDVNVQKHRRALEHCIQYRERVRSG